MAEKSLVILIIHALDYLARLKDLQELIQMVLEQDQEPLEKRCSRMGLLIDLYRPAVDLCISELEFALEQSRKLVGASAHEQD